MAKQFKERKHYVVKIGSQIVTVTREVYECYYSMDRQERYQEERDQANGLVSLSSFTDKTGGGDLEVADTRANVEEIIHSKYMRKTIKAAIDSMNERDADVLTAIYYDGYSAQEYANLRGLKKSTVSMRHKAALKKLEKLLEKL